MPMPAYMMVTGEKNGDIHVGAMGTNSVNNFSRSDKRKDWIQVQAFDHSVYLPTDPQSGQPVGKRVHRGCKVTKIFDRTSPIFMDMLTSGEQIQKITVEWEWLDKSGSEIPYMQHIFERATIIDVRQYMPNCLDPTYKDLWHMEEVTFTYKKVTWKHMQATTEAVDSWGDQTK